MSTAHLHCPVCLGAAYPPVVACKAEHLLCEGCADGIRRRTDQPKCPTCRERMPSKSRVSVGLRRAIDGYPYKCNHEGCKWTGSVGELSKHLIEACPYRQVKCPSCQAVCRYIDYDTHLRTACPEQYVRCPRGDLCAGGIKLRRKELPAHEKVCAMHKCTVEGCETLTTLANLDTHVQRCWAYWKRNQDLEKYAEDAQKALIKERAKVGRLTAKVARQAAELAAPPPAPPAEPARAAKPSAAKRRRVSHADAAEPAAAEPRREASAEADQLKQEAAAAPAATPRSTRASRRRSSTSASTAVKEEEAGPAQAA